MIYSAIFLCLFSKSMTLEKVHTHNTRRGDSYLTLYNDYSQRVEVIYVAVLNGKQFYFCEKIKKGTGK